MKRAMNNLGKFAKNHPLLLGVLITFFIWHFYLWTHYYATTAGTIHYFDFFDTYRLLFPWMGILYWLVYSYILVLAYSIGKKVFIFVLSFFLYQ